MYASRRRSTSPRRKSLGLPSCFRGCDDDDGGGGVGVGVTGIAETELIIAPIMRMFRRMTDRV